jgi:hypothetical protein
MRLYSKLYYEGSNDGPYCFIRKRLVPCEPSGFDGVKLSSNLNARINLRAGFTIDTVRHDAFGIIRGKHKGKYFYWRCY